jgi:hypothetical protein
MERDFHRIEKSLNHRRFDRLLTLLLCVSEIVRKLDLYGVNLLIQLGLKRSGTLPLDIFIECPKWWKCTS